MASTSLSSPTIHYQAFDTSPLLLLLLGIPFPTLPDSNSLFSDSAQPSCSSESLLWTPIMNQGPLLYAPNGNCTSLQHSYKVFYSKLKVYGFVTPTKLLRSQIHFISTAKTVLELGYIRAEYFSGKNYRHGEGWSECRWGSSNTGLGFN